MGYEDDLNLYQYAANDAANNADPSGEICIGPNMASAFCQRSRRYEVLHNRYRNRTDYFKAVSLMTANLANLDQPFGREAGGVSPRVYAAMDRLSAAIASFNETQALRLEAGIISGSRAAIDSRLVRDEQAFITLELATMRAADPELYEEMIAAINTNANRTGGGAAWLLERTDSQISGAAAQTRAELGRGIDFGNEGRSSGFERCTAKGTIGNFV